MRIVAIATVLVGLVFGPVSTGLTQPTDPFLVVPGQSIGPVKIGMTIEDAVKILGAPQSTRSALQSTVLSQQALQGATNYSWSAPARGGVSGQVGFRITADATGKIIA
jgi:hypothetical protein